MIEGDVAERLMGQLGERFTAEQSRGHRPVLVVAGPVRMPLRRMVRLAVPDLPILSFPELAASSVTVQTLGMIDDVRTPVGNFVS